MRLSEFHGSFFFSISHSILKYGKVIHKTSRIFILFFRILFARRCRTNSITTGLVMQVPCSRCTNNGFNLVSGSHMRYTTRALLLMATDTVLHFPFRTFFHMLSFLVSARFIHSFDLSSCWILSDVKRHNVWFCYSLPLTRHFRINTHVF